MHDHWTCPEGQHLWPHEFDHERRLVRYRAKAHICNGCPRKDRCTDSDVGREIVRPLDPWPHSEAGRFHRGIALMLLALAVFVLTVGGVRNHDPAEAALLLALIAVMLGVGRWMLRDLRAHPAGFPEPTPSHGLRMRRTRRHPSDDLRPRCASSWWCCWRRSSASASCASTSARSCSASGACCRSRGPGLVLLIPLVDRMVRVDLRTVTLTIPPQEVITRDNVPARVAAVCYFKAIDPVAAVTEIEAFEPATSQIAQTTLRSVLGRADLDQLLSERERLNEDLQQIIDEQTEPWGIKVSTVEIKDVEIPEAMQRAMARQAEAERERRAKIINSEGEFQAAEKLADAAAIIGREPSALHLRYLQTLLEIGAEQNSTIVFPLPLDLLQPFLDRVSAPAATAEQPNGHVELSRVPDRES